MSDRCPIKGIRGMEPGVWPLATCGRPAVTRVEYGCVHEHIGSIEACSKHAGEITTETSWCSACWNGPDPHRCRLLGRVAAP